MQTSARRSGVPRAPISSSPCGRSRRPRRHSSPSAACPALAKTQLARALAPFLEPMPGAVILRSDVERKALFGVGETEKLPAEAYGGEATVHVYRQARRQGPPHPCRRPFGDRRRGLRAAARTRRDGRSGEIHASSAARTIPDREPRDPLSASAGARAMPPTPTRRWRGCKAYHLGALDGRGSTLRNARSHPVRAGRPSRPLIDGG